MEAETELPEDTIQHIQSFLTPKEAAKSSVVSKSWYSAWSTRNILSFDNRDFGRIGRFSNFTRKTIKRYIKLNLKVEKFILCMYLPESLDEDSVYFADGLILIAIKLGVIDLNLEINDESYILPFQVFQAIVLKKLYIVGCQIDLSIDNPLFCSRSRLTSLSLSRVLIRDDMLNKILLGCPHLEDFHLIKCKGFKKINVSTMMHNLKNFCIRRNICLPPHTLSIEFEEEPCFFDGQINMFRYRYLTSLELYCLSFDKKFFQDFSRKFPCLEDLKVHHCGGYRDLEISSHSLKYIEFIDSGMLNKAQFDVSSICKFRFEVPMNIPSFSFKTKSREWESSILLSNRADARDISLFLNLRKFLMELEKSRIYLNITIYTEIRTGHVEDIMQDLYLYVPLVENLMLNVIPTLNMCSDFLNGLFCTCRPRSIVALHGFSPKTTNHKLIWSICNTLMNSGDHLRMHNLEEVHLEIYDEFHMNWQFLSMEEYLIASYIPNDEEKLRLQLRWGSYNRTNSLFPLPITIM